MWIIETVRDWEDLADPEGEMMGAVAMTSIFPVIFILIGICSATEHIRDRYAKH